MNSRNFWVSNTHELKLATGTGDLLDLKGICGDSSETVLQRLCGRNAVSGPPPLPLGAVGDRHHGLADRVDLVDLAQLLDNDSVIQFRVGGPQEYIGWVLRPLALPTIVVSATRRLCACARKT